jgi:hypothetical protein
MSLLAGIVAIGILWRVVHTGLVVFDKYLGDAMYATMVYTILRLVSPRSSLAAGAASNARSASAAVLRKPRNDARRSTRLDGINGITRNQRMLLNY